MTSDELRARVAELDWFERFELGGVMTPGRHDLAALRARLDLPDDLTGLRVLDAGTCDGGNALWALSRGAASVVAVDHPEWGEAGHGRRRREPFDLAVSTLPPSAAPWPVEMDLDSAWADWPIALDRFDLILYLGVAYHLKSPLAALEGLCGLLAPGGRLVVETHVAALEVPYPAARLYPAGELAGDRTNHSGWNGPAWLGYLEKFGLDARQVGPVRMCPHGNHRAVFHADRPPTPE